MRNTPAPPPLITDHSLTRFLAAVWLRLLRMAGQLLVGVAPRREDLNAFSRFVAAFLIIRAVRLVGAARPSPGAAHPVSAAPGFRQRDLPTSFSLNRAALGARLRRRLRGHDALAHISALIGAILNLDALTVELARRLKRRLTRLRPLVLVHAYADALPCSPRPRPCADDSS